MRCEWRGRFSTLSPIPFRIPRQNISPKYVRRTQMSHIGFAAARSCCFNALRVRSYRIVIENFIHLSKRISDFIYTWGDLRKADVSWKSKFWNTAKNKNGVEQVSFQVFNNNVRHKNFMAEKYRKYSVSEKVIQRK